MPNDPKDQKSSFPTQGTSGSNSSMNRPRSAASRDFAVGNGNDPADKLRTLASTAREKAVEVGKEQLDQGAGMLAGHIDEVEQTVSSVADTLRENDQESLATYADTIASQVSSVSNSLKDKSAEQLISDVMRSAKRNPGLFIAGSIVAGFALSRFLRATSDRSASEYAGQTDRSGSMAPAVDHGSRHTIGAGDSSPDAGGSDRQGGNTGGTSSPLASGGIGPTSGAPGATRPTGGTVQSIEPNVSGSFASPSSTGEPPRSSSLASASSIPPMQTPQNPATAPAQSNLKPKSP